MIPLRALFTPLLLGLALVLGGCAVNPIWPAITEEPSEDVMPGRWVWIDLITSEPQTARDFYSQVFGWQFITQDSKRPGYQLIMSGDHRIGGMLDASREAIPISKTHWLGVLSVEDVAVAQRATLWRNGSVTLSARELQGRGTTAVLEDPEGAVFAVLRSDSGDPPDRFAPVGGLIWMELWTPDGAGMADFYSHIANYEVERDDDIGDLPEWHLIAFGYPRAGIVQMPDTERRSAWLPYLRVTDLSAALARIKAAGGTVLLAPSAEIRQGRIAIAIDPLGAAFGLAEWTDEQADTAP